MDSHITTIVVLVRTGTAPGFVEHARQPTRSVGTHHLRSVAGLLAALAVAAVVVVSRFGAGRIARQRPLVPNTKAAHTCSSFLSHAREATAAAAAGAASSRSKNIIEEAIR